MFGKELYRILSRKITLPALFLAAALTFFMNNSIWEEGVIDNGQIYRYGQAIAKDKAIAEEFTGILTEEKVRAIWEKYGAPVNAANRSLEKERMQGLAGQGGNDNYCNLFVAKWFAQETTGEDGRAKLSLPEELPEEFLNGKYYFGYTGQGWGFYGDKMIMNIVMSFLAAIIGICPMFSEDYAYRTADVILPTKKGRFHLWLLRTGTGFVFASVCYWLICGITFFTQYFLYGPEGLRVSCVFSDMPYEWTRWDTPFWKSLLEMHFWGWFSVLILVLQIQAVSAKCRSSFAALLWSLAVLFGPIAVIRLVLDHLPQTWLNMYLQQIGYGMPVSFSVIFLQASLKGKRILLRAAVLSGILGTALGIRNWCRHEVKS